MSHACRSCSGKANAANAAKKGAVLNSQLHKKQAQLEHLHQFLRLRTGPPLSLRKRRLCTTASSTACKKLAPAETSSIFSPRNASLGICCIMTSGGQKYPQLVPIASKMEVMLGTVLEQRKLHIDRLTAAGDPRVPPWRQRDGLARLKFTSEDMKEIMNSWRLDVESWMHPSKLAVYHDSPKWHQIGKSAFSVFLQHLSGCKFLLRRLIALPLLAEGAGAAQSGAVEEPEILRELTQEWTVYKNSEEHQKAMQKSQPRYKQERLSKRLCEAETWYKQGAKLSRMVLDKSVEFLDLTRDERQMVEDYDCRRSARILDGLLKEKMEAQPYRGAGVVLQ